MRQSLSSPTKKGPKSFFQTIAKNVHRWCWEVGVLSRRSVLDLLRNPILFLSHVSAATYFACKWTMTQRTRSLLGLVLPVSSPHPSSHRIITQWSWEPSIITSVWVTFKPFKIVWVLSYSLVPFWSLQVLVLYRWVITFFSFTPPIISIMRTGWSWYIYAPIIHSSFGWKRTCIYMSKAIASILRVLTLFAR